MFSILTIIQSVFVIFALGLVLWGIKIGVSYYIFAKKREEINHLHAKISVLKTHLKAKMKKKWNLIENKLYSEKAFDMIDEIKPIMTTLCNYSYSSPLDYQESLKKLADISEKILAYVERKRRQAPSANPKSADEEQFDKLPVEEKRVQYLVKYDLGSTMIIAEIVDVTIQLIERIKEYNSLAELDKKQKKITDIPKKIEIEHFMMITLALNKAKGTISGVAHETVIPPVGVSKKSA